MKFLNLFFSYISFVSARQVEEIKAESCEDKTADEIREYCLSKFFSLEEFFMEILAQNFWDFRSSMKNLVNVDSGYPPSKR